ncbi:MAG TPA: hypothetical protein VJ599_05545 [Nitrososphaeraceae archaeon]|nr:hypothetical protein [Nitrososphaeraceae archaeon]
MLNTKKVLMLVMLSAGLLTVITGTGMSNVVPVFAEEDECEDNGDDSCNEQTQKTKLENECKIVNEIENEDRSDENINGEIVNGDVICNISTVSEEDNVTNEPGDVVICHRPSGNPTQEQTLSLSQNSADSHLNNHPFDTLGPCENEDIFAPIS